MQSLLLRAMLRDITPPHPLLFPNELHRAGADPRESGGGTVRYSPLPPYLMETHWSTRCPHSARLKWSRQQTLHDLGSRLGWPCLSRLLAALNVGRMGHWCIVKPH